MIGIGQYSPLASVIFSTTLFQSSLPCGPVRGAKPPFPIISKSAVWRSVSCSFNCVLVMGSGSGVVESRSSRSGKAGRVQKAQFGVGTLAVQSALGLLEPGPAARPGVLADGRLPGAVGAADRRVALVVQRVVGDVVLVDVGPDLLLRPIGEWVQLPEPEAPVPAELRRPSARLGVRAANAGDPQIDGGEGGAHRLDLADSAARIGVSSPELVPVEARLLLERDAAVSV